jgi:hypothetical protein
LFFVPADAGVDGWWTLQGVVGLPDGAPKRREISSAARIVASRISRRRRGDFFPRM